MKTSLKIALFSLGLFALLGGLRMGDAIADDRLGFWKMPNGHLMRLEFPGGKQVEYKYEDGKVGKRFSGFEFRHGRVDPDLGHKSYMFTPAEDAEYERVVYYDTVFIEMTRRLSEHLPLLELLKEFFDPIKGKAKRLIRTPVTNSSTAVRDWFVAELEPHMEACEGKDEDCEISDTMLLKYYHATVVKMLWETAAYTLEMGLQEIEELEREGLDQAAIDAKLFETASQVPKTMNEEEMEAWVDKMQERLRSEPGFEHNPANTFIEDVREGLVQDKVENGDKERFFFRPDAVVTDAHARVGRIQRLYSSRVDRHIRQPVEEGSPLDQHIDAAVELLRGCAPVYAAHVEEFTDGRIFEVDVDAPTLFALSYPMDEAEIIANSSPRDWLLAARYGMKDKTKIYFDSDFVTYADNLSGLRRMLVGLNDSVEAVHRRMRRFGGQNFNLRHIGIESFTQYLAYSLVQGYFGARSYDNMFWLRRSQDASLALALASYEDDLIMAPVADMLREKLLDPYEEILATTVEFSAMDAMAACMNPS